MSKKDKVEENITVDSVDQVLPVPPAVIKRFTFEQWATARGIKEQHKGGLVKYCKNINKLRTFSEWDKCFEQY